MHAHALSKDGKMTCFLEWKEYDLRILLEILLICYSIIHIHVIHYVYKFFAKNFGYSLEYPCIHGRPTPTNNTASCWLYGFFVVFS